MKLLLANKFFFLNGGSERVLFQERNFLIEQGAQVVDFSMADSRNFFSPYSSFFVSNINYNAELRIRDKVRQGSKFIHSSEAIEKIEKLIQREKPDIAHIHNVYHQLTPSIIPVLKRHGVKIVLTLHDGKLICPSYLMLNNGEICTECAGHHFWKTFANRCQNSLFREMLLTFEAYWHKWKRSYDGVDLFIAPSRFIAELISQRIVRDKIRVLPNGIEADKFSPSYQDEGYGLYFGRLSKEKGVGTLLESHKSIANILSLKVVGTGPMEKELHTAYPHAEFLGYKNGEELIDIINRAAFVIVPSECYENCSMVVLEAMAMGKPVIGSRMGGIPEQVEDGKTGILFQAGNSDELKETLLFLSQKSDIRTNMGQLARIRFEQHFSLNIHCRKLYKIYEELVY